MRHYLSLSHYTEFVPGSPVLRHENYDIEEISSLQAPKLSLKCRIFKACVDGGCTAIALPLIAVISILLFLLNPLFNPGPVFFNQSRLGRDGKPFRMWKFRSMVASDTEAREANAPLELERIPPLGVILRKSRIDELPNFFNVLMGDMSVVGPRPEAASHAALYSNTVPGYAARLRVKPGITGLAQVEQGYVEDESATALKAKYDNMYVERLCGRLDLYIIIKTFRVMAGGFGAR